jgi:DNA-binding transcriptional ArsR family regulator
MDEALKALADGTRRRILALVSQQERTAGDIAGNFTVSRPAISQHLRVLLDAGLVSVRGDGTKRFYRADALGLDALRQEMETLWIGRLTQLKQVAEEEARAAERDANTPPSKRDETIKGETR